MKTKYLAPAIILLAAIAVGAGAYYFFSSTKQPGNTVSTATNTATSTQGTVSSGETSRLKPAAQIDQASLTQEVPEAVNPDISGTANNVASVSVYISGEEAGFADVINGHWTARLPNSKTVYGPGSYSLAVKDNQGDTLASGTLHIIAPVTVDDPSLGAKPGPVTITGTAASLKELKISIISDETRDSIASGTVSVVGGKWSFAAGTLSQGTYYVEIYDPADTFKDILIPGAPIWVSGSQDSLVVHQ